MTGNQLRVVVLISAVAVTAVLLVLLGTVMAQNVSDSSTTSLPQGWHSVQSPFCSEIKAKDAKIAGRPFAVYAAPAADSRCCEGLPRVAKGKTERFGVFKISGLVPGRYFVLFDLKMKQVIVPVLVDRALNSKECFERSRITVERQMDRLKWGPAPTGPYPSPPFPNMGQHLAQ